MVGAELLKTGQLSQVIERVAGEVKAKPSDLAARTFYFELLSLNGDLERASRQLDALSSITGELVAGTDAYAGAIQAERERRQFFHGGPRPRVLCEPSYARFYLEAIEHYAVGDIASTVTGLEAATETDRGIRGKLNGSEFQELSDSHDLLAPFLEVVMENHYAWVPWETIQSLVVPEPRFLRDTIWTPASLTLHSGDHGEILVFALYVDSHLKADDIKLGHRTIWDTNDAGFTIAYGQKMIAAGDHDCPILEMRNLEVEACRLAA